LRIDSTWSSSPSTEMPPFVASISAGAAEHGVVLQQVRHDVERAEVVDGDDVDVGTCCFAARKKLRPIRPNPLMPDTDCHGIPVPFVPCVGCAPERTRSEASRSAHAADVYRMRGRQW
jgi:hypothetical protein